MKGEMSTQDMAAALLLVNGESSESAAAQIGMNGRTLRRRSEQPHFKAYMDKLRTKKGEELEAIATPAPEVTVVRPMSIVFTRDDAAMRYLRIADDKTATHANQRMAVDSLVALFGIAKQPVIAPNPQGADATPEKPSFYRAAWRDPVN